MYGMTLTVMMCTMVSLAYAPYTGCQAGSSSSGVQGMGGRSSAGMELRQRPQQDANQGASAGSAAHEDGQPPRRAHAHDQHLLPPCAIGLPTSSRSHILSFIHP